MSSRVDVSLQSGWTPTLSFLVDGSLFFLVCTAPPSSALLAGTLLDRLLSPRYLSYPRHPLFVLFIMMRGESQI